VVGRWCIAGSSELGRGLRPLQDSAVHLFWTTEVLCEVVVEEGVCFVEKLSKSHRIDNTTPCSCWHVVAPRVVVICMG
jgi:hypothetical protein